jgi:hypothetical protein
MKKTFLTVSVIAVMAIFGSLYGQSYQSAIGARLGVPFAASYKMFISEPGAIEIFAGFRGYPGYSWVSANALYQHHSPIKSVENLSWYVGGGAGVQFWNWKNSALDDSNTSISIMGVIGLDYKFAEIPLNLSLDWMPTYFLGGYIGGFGGGYGSLSARYVLK